MAYQTLCGKYGMRKTYPAALAAGCVLFGATMFLGGFAPITAWDSVLLIGSGVGGTSFAAATIAEVVTRKILKSKNIGPYKGSKILKKSQLIAYCSVTLIMGAYLGATFSKVAKKEKPAPVKEQTIAPEQKNPRMNVSAFTVG